MLDNLGCIFGLLVLYLLAIPVWLLIEWSSRRATDREVEQSLRMLRSHITKLETALAQVERRPEQQPGKPLAEPAPVSVRETSGPSLQQPERPLPEPAPHSADAPMAPPAQATPVAAPPAQVSIPEPQPAPLPSAPEPVHEAKAPAPPPVLPRVPLKPAPGPAWSFDWEALVGVKLFSWVAGVALLVAAVTFLRYGIQNGWLTNPIRMSIGIVTGIGLLALCETRRAQAYPVTAQALTAAGIATLFSTFYASHALWHLLGALPTFLLLVLVTAVAAALSIRRDSVFIALLGLVGGFAAPALLSTGSDNPLGLFGYLALLDAGLAWVAYRRRWATLSVLSLVFTTIYQLSWVIRFLTESKLGIGIGIFLLFPVLVFGCFILAKQRSEEELPALFQKTVPMAGIPPLLFALHWAAVRSYGGHYAMMFGFLFLIVVGLAAIAVLKGPEWLHLLGSASTLAIFAVWLSRSYSSQAWPAILAFVALFQGLFLLVPWLQGRWKRWVPFKGPARFGVYAAPLLLALFPVLPFIEPATSTPWAIFLPLFGLAACHAAFAIWSGEGLVHVIACCFLLATEATWSCEYLQADRLYAALAIYGGSALFFLAVPLLAARKAKVLRPEGSGTCLVFGSLGLLAFLTSTSIAPSSLWVLALLLAGLNLGLTYEASHGRLPALAQIGAVLSWLLLAAWWHNAPLVGLVVPALLVTGAFSLMLIGSSLWLKNGATFHILDQDLPPPALYLALAGHVFLMVIAARPELAWPPWPWLAALFVLDLALSVAAFYLRRGEILVGASVLTQLVVGIWAGNSPAGTLVTGAAWSAVVFGLLGHLWTEGARRRQAAGEAFTIAAGTGIFLAWGVLALCVSWPPGELPYGHLLPQCLLLVGGVLFLAWRTRQPGWALGLAPAAGLVVCLWWEPLRSLHDSFSWIELFGLAIPIWLVQLAYPLLLGRRARQEKLSFYAAILASAIFFFFGREGFLQAGLGSCIGALPVFQALLLVPHLVLLLRLERGGTRDSGLLVLVAGSILAFISVAIPLQLEKQWITVGWALLAAALAWLHGRVPHKGLVIWSGSLAGAVFARLVFNPAVFTYYPRSATPILNWYLYAYLACAASCFAAAWFLKSADDRIVPNLPRLSRILPGAGAVIIFLLLNIEIADAFSSGPVLSINLAHGSLAQDLSYTIGWAVYAILMLVAGIIAGSRITRVSAIILLTVCILKAFLHDLSRLEGLYRVGSFVGLAICLSMVAIILQRFVLRKTEVAA